MPLYAVYRNEAVSKQQAAWPYHELVREFVGLGAGAGEDRCHGLEGQLCQWPLWDVHQVEIHFQTSCAQCVLTLEGVFPLFRHDWCSVYHNRLLWNAVLTHTLWWIAFGVFSSHFCRMPIKTIYTNGWKKPKNNSYHLNITYMATYLLIFICKVVKLYYSYMYHMGQKWSSPYFINYKNVLMILYTFCVVVLGVNSFICKWRKRQVVQT